MVILTVTLNCTKQVIHNLKWKCLHIFNKTFIGILSKYENNHNHFHQGEIINLVSVFLRTNLGLAKEVIFIRDKSSTLFPLFLRTNLRLEKEPILTRERSSNFFPLSLRTNLGLKKESILNMKRSSNLFPLFYSHIWDSKKNHISAWKSSNLFPLVLRTNLSLKKNNHFLRDRDHHTCFRYFYSQIWDSKKNQFHEGEITKLVFVVFTHKFGSWNSKKNHFLSERFYFIGELTLNPFKKSQ